MGQRRIRDVRKRLRTSQIGLCRGEVSLLKAAVRSIRWLEEGHTGSTAHVPAIVILYRNDDRDGVETVKKNHTRHIASPDIRTSNTVVRHNTYTSIVMVSNPSCI